MKLELKKLKVHRDMSQETTCFSATLFIDGKKAGTVENRGTGGCNCYFWLDRKMEKEVLAWAKTQPVAVPGVEELDQVIGDLIDNDALLKRLTRLTRNSILFRLKGDEKGSWRSIKKPSRASLSLSSQFPYHLDYLDYLNRKFGENLECIANEDLQKAIAYC